MMQYNMASLKNVALIGYASGAAASDDRCRHAAHMLQQAKLEHSLQDHHVHAEWLPIFSGPELPHTDEARRRHVLAYCRALSEQVKESIQSGSFPLVFGGDHAMAIGTWSGVVDAYDAYEQMGLIWIDAHLDAHTPDTSLTGNIHGMPLAVLLGHGLHDFVMLQKPQKKFSPNHVVVMGVRSYEAGELALLKELCVKIFFMDEIRARGFSSVFEEAVSIVNKAPSGFGVSLDVDVFDPIVAPGTGTKVRNGLHLEDVEASFRSLFYRHGLRGFEFAEFNPSLDRENQTLHIIKKLVSLMAQSSN